MEVLVEAVNVFVTKGLALMIFADIALDLIRDQDISMYTWGVRILLRGGAKIENVEEMGSRIVDLYSKIDNFGWHVRGLHYDMIKKL